MKEGIGEVDYKILNNNKVDWEARFMEMVVRLCKVSLRR